MHERSIMADKRRYYESREIREEAGRSNSSARDRDDEPPNSRLFILCGKNVTEDELRESFHSFGLIKELWIVKEKDSGASRGIAYIKYSKTSEAAVAMEEMNGRFIANNAKALKVLIASGREQGSKRDQNEHARLLRLYIIVPKHMSETELREHFSQFGEIEHCTIVRDRNTKESRGFGYVKFKRISHAAKAFEECDRQYKPRFADPPPRQEDRYSSAHGSTTGPYDLHEYAIDASHHYQPMINHHNQITSGHLEAPNRLTIIANPQVNQDQLWKLCDFFPGLDYCNVRHEKQRGQSIATVATVVYNSSQSAAIAKEKLHGFEYPPGHRLIVKYETPDPSRPVGGSGLLGSPQGSSRYALAGSSINGGSASGALPTLVGRATASCGPLPPDLASLTETIAQATAIIQAAGLNAAATSGGVSHHSQGETYDPKYCSVKLPPPQPLAPMDSPVVERLFVVCSPSPPPHFALIDVFGRFGNLIDIFMLSGKNFGYAKYASQDSADEARNMLHGQKISDSRLKVFRAEPQEKSNTSSPSAGSSSDQKCKRPKLEADID